MGVDRIISKALAVATILLFLGVGIQSAIAEELSHIDNEYQPSKLFWKTYMNCNITGEFWINWWPPWFLELLILRNQFAFVFICLNFVSCELSGHKGTISISQIIGFGFTGKIHISFDSDFPSNIDGHFLFCIFR